MRQAPWPGGRLCAVRAVVQRVRSAEVTVGGCPSARSESGLLVLSASLRTTREEAEHSLGKIARLRIFENPDGRFDLSVLDTGGEALVVSQFTLLADSKRQKGTRPDFSKSSTPGSRRTARRAFLRRPPRPGMSVANRCLRSEDGVKLVNDGPVTIVLG